MVRQYDPVPPYFFCSSSPPHECSALPSSHSSDPAIKEFLKFLDESMILGKRFILFDLDERHLFVMEGIAGQLQQKLDELMEKNSYSEYGADQQGPRVRREY